MVNYVKLDCYGCAVVVKEDALYSCPILSDNSLEKDEENDKFDGLAFSEVTAPTSQAFLDEVNSHFSTNFKKNQFSGR